MSDVILADWWQKVALDFSDLADTSEAIAGKPVIGVSFEHTGITNEGRMELKAFKHLQSLNLNRCYRITDAALLEIAELKSFRSLDLGFTGLQTVTAVNGDHLGESFFVTLVFRAFTT